MTTPYLKADDVAALLLDLAKVLERHAARISPPKQRRPVVQSSHEVRAKTLARLGIDEASL